MGEGTAKGRKLGDAEFLRLMVETLGIQRAGRLMLFCWYWAATGRRTFGQVARDQDAPGVDQWGYRAYRDLRLLRQKVAEAEGRPWDVVDLAERLSGTGPSSGEELLAPSAGH